MNLHESVLRAWHSYSEPLEGRVSHMYLDVKSLITTGVGNLIDGANRKTPPPSVFVLPWRVDGRELATRQEITEHWTYLKSRTDLAKRHYKYAEDAFKMRFGHVLRLLDEDIDILVMNRLQDFAAHATKTWPEFPNFPADAQLAILSMYWALGSLTKFPNCAALVAKQDWAGCAQGAPETTSSPGWDKASYACKIKETKNPGVRPRNQQNVRCFRNAAVVARDGGSVSMLHWPNSLFGIAPPTPPTPLRPTLRIGSRGEHVKVLQEKLGIPVDGFFGPKTQAAVMDAQHRAKLNPDGVVGQKTWGIL